jgi:hypothetical protein
MMVRLVPKLAPVRLLVTQRPRTLTRMTTTMTGTLKIRNHKDLTTEVAAMEAKKLTKETRGTLATLLLLGGGSGQDSHLCVCRGR